MNEDLRPVLDEDDITAGLRLESLNGEFHCAAVRSRS